MIGLRKRYQKHIFRREQAGDTDGLRGRVLHCGWQWSDSHPKIEEMSLQVLLVVQRDE